MQAALLLGASRGYVGKFRDCFIDLKRTSALSVAAATYSTVAAGAMPLSLGLAVGIGILVGHQIYHLGMNIKTMNDKNTIEEHRRLQIVFLAISNLCFFVGAMCLEYYTSVAAIICIIGLLNCVWNVSMREKEIFKSGVSKISAMNEAPKFMRTLITIESLATLLATISAFTTINLFGVPIILIVFYLKLALVLLDTCLLPLVPGKFWYNYFGL